MTMAPVPARIRLLLELMLAVPRMCACLTTFRVWTGDRDCARHTSRLPRDLRVAPF